MRVSKSQAILMSALIKGNRGNDNRRMQSYERGFNNADSASPSAVTVGTGLGNVAFTDQFTINILLRYFTVVTTVYTTVAAAAIAAILKTQLAVFIFGNGDSQSGYAKLRQAFPLIGGWLYNDIFIYGYTQARTAFSNLDATALAVLQIGDLVLPFSATTAGPINTVCLVIVRMSNGQYSALLADTSSDTFNVVRLRYSVDVTAVSQFNNPVGVYNQSIFGATKSDLVDPIAFKSAVQFQTGILDIDLRQTINKATAWASYVNFDATATSNIAFAVFVNGTNKLR